MKREEAAALYEIYERALRTLSEAEPVIFSLSKNDDQHAIAEAHRDVMCKILSRLRTPLVLQYPDLDTEIPDGHPDTLLDPAEQDLVSILTPDQIRCIDEALLSGCAASWTKVAKVVDYAMEHVSESVPAVADGYYAQRVSLLVQAGRIESQGNLDYMRYSEVRLVS